MNILITGITGMVGSHLADYILAEHPNTAVHGLVRWRSPLDNIAHLRGRVELHLGELRDLNSMVSPVVVTGVRQRLLQLVQDASVAVSRLRWVSDKVALVQQWSTGTHDAREHPLLAPLTSDAVEIELRRCLRGLVMLGKGTPAFTQALLQRCGPRAATVVQQEQCTVARVRLPQFLSPTVPTGASQDEVRRRKRKRRQE
jgi:hypothetical protein